MAPFAQMLAVNPDKGNQDGPILQRQSRTYTYTLPSSRQLSVPETNDTPSAWLNSLLGCCVSVMTAPPPVDLGPTLGVGYIGVGLCSMRVPASISMVYNRTDTLNLSLAGSMGPPLSKPSSITRRPEARVTGGFSVSS